MEDDDTPSAPASDGSKTLVLTPDEQKAFQQLLDTALRHAGLGALEVCVHFSRKLAEATV